MRLIADGNENFARELRVFLRQLAAWTGLVTAGLLLGGQAFRLPGFLAGTAANLVYVFLVYVRVKHCAELPAGKAVTHMRTGWLVRLTFLTLALILAIKLPWLDFPAVVAGILSAQIVIFLNGVYFLITRLIFARKR